jgi:hypothetical protein
VEVKLRPAVSRPVCPGVRHPSGTRDQFFFLLEIFFRQLRVCYFVASRRTQYHILLSQFLGKSCPLEVTWSSLGPVIDHLNRSTRDSSFACGPFPCVENGYHSGFHRLVMIYHTTRHYIQRQQPSQSPLLQPPVLESSVTTELTCFILAVLG